IKPFRYASKNTLTVRILLRYRRMEGESSCRFCPKMFFSRSTAFFRRLSSVSLDKYPFEDGKLEKCTSGSIEIRIARPGSEILEPLSYAAFSWFEALDISNVLCEISAQLSFILPGINSGTSIKKPLI